MFATVHVSQMFLDYKSRLVSLLVVFTDVIAICQLGKWE